MEDLVLKHSFLLFLQSMGDMSFFPLDVVDIIGSEAGIRFANPNFGAVLQSGALHIREQIPSFHHDLVDFFLDCNICRADSRGGNARRTHA